MHKITEITNKRYVVPISLTEDLTRAMKERSKTIKGCPRQKVGSISYYAWVAIIEKLARDGLDMGKIDSVYKLMS